MTKAKTPLLILIIGFTAVLGGCRADPSARRPVPTQVPLLPTLQPASQVEIPHSPQAESESRPSASEALVLSATLLKDSPKDPAPIDDIVLPAEAESAAFPGGQATVFNTTPNAFSHPSDGLERMDELLFFVGNSFFNQNWVTAPASTTARDGLGPLFNARSCAGCHFKDGRGRPPAFDDEFPTGFLLRISIPGEGAHGAPLPVPNYGVQLQVEALLGIEEEAKVRVEYEEIEGQFADGTTYSLRKPTYTIVEPSYGHLPPDLMISPRVANQMIGLGLLEAIPEEALLSLVDPDDANGDGISGRANRVWDQVNQQMAMGRFGWKANQPNLEQQVAGAFSGDMGISTYLFPKQNCTAVQSDCQATPHGGTPEIDDDDFGKVVLYSSTLAVPARRNMDDPQVTLGRQTFHQLGCAACHVPMFETSEHPTIDALSNQTIYPYTDLLLHDMGGGLSDGRPDYEATGSEWRTPPLWGIGLIDTVNRHTNFLHDGRARSIMEAILWHGGEAEPAKERVRGLSQEDRDALVAFLESL